MLAQLKQRVEAHLPAPRMPAIPDTDQVALDERRHPVVLLMPALRTVAGLVVAVAGMRPLLLLLVFALAVGGWARRRLRSGLKTTVVIFAVAFVGLAVLGGSGGLRTLLGVGLVLWFLEDLADWYGDRLIATNKRLYRLYGVFTSHSPSMALTAIAFIDPQQSVLGKLLGYGTIMLDSAAQDDKTLARFDHIQEPQQVHLQILKLRSAAMPKYPPITGS